METRSYISIDLKSFYASVECLKAGLDPMRTNLVVADASRTEKTICLAVTPSLKFFGIPGRARLFEVVQKVREANARRVMKAPGGKFTGKSSDANELKNNPALAIDFIAAPPRMALYLDYSTRIYDIYLKYIAPEDIHVYSIDEVFMDVTSYLKTYGLTPHELTIKIIRDVLAKTGITATAGIGTNLYLAKIAMDIVAKKMPPDEDGVRIAELDEMTYRQQLWTHEPLRDFWRVGAGYSKKLAAYGLVTMGDIARCSLGKPTDFHNEDLLYKLFGINAELLIDHAWGYEPVTMAQVKAYKPATNSVSSGQVLQSPYTWEKARLVVHEMTELMVLDLVEKELVTDQMVLHVGYDIESLTDPEISKKYKGPVSTDMYGRQVPKSAHGSKTLPKLTSSTKVIVDAVLEIFDETVNQNLLIRRINLGANHLVPQEKSAHENDFQQLDLFADYLAPKEEKEALKEAEEKEKQIQQAMLEIKKKYGKNAILKGMNLEEGATAKDRNRQIGGHKA